MGLSTLAQPDRFGDINEMSGNRFTSGFATFFGLVDRVHEITPIGITK
ncbi:MAG: hypothetical protein K9H64_14020 [Bacteroidales bacterium]|nr:hypothetical protein [Bacteroidales bacterium]MCF8457082.1 hypothetical protein [Bacteroidales bacterium]